MSQSDDKDSAGIIVFRRQQHKTFVLMIRQGAHHFSFPKGHIENGETKEEAALRETLEETGIWARLLQDFCYAVSSSKSKDKRQVYFFAGEYLDGTPHPQTGETTDAFWIHVKDAADKITFSQDKAAFLAALRVFEHHF